MNGNNRTPLFFFFRLQPSKFIDVSLFYFQILLVLDDGLHLSGVSQSERSVVFSKFSDLLCVLRKRPPTAETSSSFSTLWEITAAKVRATVNNPESTATATEAVACLLTQLQSGAAAAPLTSAKERQVQLKPAPKKKSGIRFEEDGKEPQTTAAAATTTTTSCPRDAGAPMLAENVEELTRELVAGALASSPAEQEEQQVKFVTRLLIGSGKSRGFFVKLNRLLFPNHPALKDSDDNDDEAILFLLQHWVLVRIRERDVQDPNLVHLGVALSDALRTSKARAAFYKHIIGRKDVISFF